MERKTTPPFLSPPAPPAPPARPLHLLSLRAAGFPLLAGRAGEAPKTCRRRTHSQPFRDGYRRMASKTSAARASADVADERYSQGSHAFLGSSDDAEQISMWFRRNLKSLVDLSSARVKSCCQVLSFRGSSAFTDISVAITLCESGHFSKVIFVAQHTTAAYLHSAGKAIQINKAARPLLNSGKLVFYAGDTDISRPTEVIDKQLAAVYERRFDVLMFHRCLRRLASPREAVSQCIRTLLASGGTAVVFHAIDDGLGQLRDAACGVDRSGMQLLNEDRRREFLDRDALVGQLAAAEQNSGGSGDRLNCRICPLGEILPISVSVRMWADAADGWTTIGTDSLTHVLGVEMGGEDEFAFRLRAHLLPLFYERRQRERVGKVGIILLQSNENPNASKLVSAGSSGRTSAVDPWWPNGFKPGDSNSFHNVGLENWHAQRARWRIPQGVRRPPPPPIEYEAVIEGLAVRQRTFQLPGWIGLTDLIDMYIDLWEMDY